jgi:flavoprotein
LFLRLCVEMCERCADECEKHPHDHYKACALACRKCAELCLHHAEVH